MSLKKIDIKDIKLIKEVDSKVKTFNMFNESFYEIFNKSNIIKKLFLKKNFRCIEANDKIVGYIWWRNIDKNYCEIKSFCIDENNITDEEIRKIKLELNSKNKNIIYETFNRGEIPAILLKLDFNKKDITEVMCLNKKLKFQCENTDKIMFRTFKRDKDEEVRCDLQNNIFDEEERIPLTLNDIYYDEYQSYYIEDLSIVMEYDNIPIGYGQIIKSKSEYTLVNFGIIDGYRGNGFGKILLKRIINLAIDKNIEELYLRVSAKNNIAKNLYKSVGFREIGKIINWEMKKATKL